MLPKNHSMEALPKVTDLTNLSGTYVLVCMAADVPIEDGVVTNHFRLTQAYPTLDHLVGQGARVLVMGHVGRDPENTMLPVFNVLKEQYDAVWAGALTGTEVTEKRNVLQDGQLLVLENNRSDAREKVNDDSLAQELAELADIYVNDDFPTSHRDYVSITGITRHLPAYAGRTFNTEYEELMGARSPHAPALFLLGGAKFETKAPLVEQFLDTYDHIFVTGALANDFFKAKGYNVGTSLVSDEELSLEHLLENPKILLPVDVRVKGPAGVRTTTPDDVADDEAILDAGPETTKMLADHIALAKTILWNGPFGNYEAGFGFETVAAARLIADASGYSIVGGGDTVAAIEAEGLNDKFNFLSTAGGAMLTLLEKGTLPGIEAIKASHS